VLCAGADRLVSAQDYFLEPEDSQHDGTDRTYNLRKINELPFHLLHAQLFSERIRDGQRWLDEALSMPTDSSSDFPAAKAQY